MVSIGWKYEKRDQLGLEDWQEEPKVICCPIRHQIAFIYLKARDNMQDAGDSMSYLLRTKLIIIFAYYTMQYVPKFCSPNPVNRKSMSTPLTEKRQTSAYIEVGEEEEEEHLKVENQMSTSLVLVGNKILIFTKWKCIHFLHQWKILKKWLVSL